MNPTGTCPACGRRHADAVETVVVGPDAVARLAADLVAGGHTRVLLVDDVNTEAAAGRAVVAALEGRGVSPVQLCFPERRDLLADAGHEAEVVAALRETGASLAVAVGSGVITDLVRAAGATTGRPFVAVPTAASMDGYASGVAAMQYDGVKITTPARPPVGLYADPVVLATAPAEMAVSGLGDLLGKVSARLDWLLAHHLYGEEYCPLVADEALSAAVAAAEATPGVVRRDPEALGLLLQGLITSGQVMARFGNSRPASGAEHHLSHLLDLLAFAGRRPHAPHGLQVGVATRVLLRLWAEALGRLGELRPPETLATTLDADLAARLGGEPPALRAAQEEKRRWVADRSELLAAARPRWPAIRDLLAAEVDRLGPMADAALEAAGVPADLAALGLVGEDARAALRAARHLRARYSLLDLLTEQGLLEQVLESAGVGREGPPSGPVPPGGPGSAGDTG